jgi:hypothetical protein
LGVALAGYAGPGFHNWPIGHIPQAPETNAFIRIRTRASPDVARTPLFHKRIDRLSNDPPTGIRLRNNHAAAKPPL